MKRDKAFKQLLAASSTANKFNGRDSLDYDPWKKDLQVEVEHLELSDRQWLQLLEARTTGEPQSIIKRLKIIQLESSPKLALETAWEDLDERYETTRRPAQELLENLTKGPELKAGDTESMFAFLQRCKAAQKLHQKNPAFLRTIEDQTT